MQDRIDEGKETFTGVSDIGKILKKIQCKRHSTCRRNSKFKNKSPIQSIISANMLDKVLLD